MLCVFTADGQFRRAAVARRTLALDLYAYVMATADTGTTVVLGGIFLVF